MVSPRISLLLSHLALKPDDPFIRYGLAIEYVNDGRDGEAKAYFEHLLKEHPDYVPTYLHAGQLFEREADASRARGVYEKGIEMARAKGDTHAARELQGVLDMMIV